MADEPETPAVTMTRMAMGSDVPEWLLVVEPRSAQSRKGAFRFAADVMLYETPDHYLLEPVELLDRPLLDLSQCIDCRLSAASKQVRMTVALTTFMLASETPEVPIDGPIASPFNSLERVGYGNGPGLGATPPWLMNRYNDPRMQQPTPSGNLPQAISFPRQPTEEIPARYRSTTIRRGVLRRAWDWLFG